MITTVYLIRHGETEWNVNGRWQGHADIPLNGRGHQQARLLAQRLHNERITFNYIYSSDLTRAYQTAWEVGAAMKVAVELLPPLREIDLGAWSGMTKEEIRTRYPVEYSLLERREDIPRGGAETMSALRERVVKAIEALVAQHHGETLAFFTHGGCIRVMLTYVCQEFDISKLPCPHIGNTSITVLTHTPAGWKMELCNDMEHLVAAESQMPDLLTTPPDDAEQPARWNP